MNIPFKKHILTSIIVTTLTACGGSDSGSDTDPILEPSKDELTAIFVDSAVAGLDYECDESKGKTSSIGEFTLFEGETCSFSINGFNIGKTDKITADNLVVTPYDTAENAEQAIKVAAILQTIDADGDPSNGIDIENFDKVIPTNILEQTTESDFIEELAAALSIPESDIVTLDAAEEHLNTTVTEKKGYHSKAVQEVIDDIIAISPTIEKVDYATKLAEYQATLEAGDDSTNNDIEVLQAIIAITEVINNATILTRVDFSSPNDPFSYTDMLPKLIDAATQEPTDYILNFDDKITGSSDDVAALLYGYAVALVNLSDKLGASFSDENYIAMYDKDGDLKINYQNAQSARMAALSVAQQLSLIAAYDIGSDEYVMPKTEMLKDIPVLKFNYETGETTADTQDVEADTIAMEYDPKSYLADENSLTLRQDAKYLTTAKNALTQLTAIAKTIDLALVDPDATTDDNAETTNEINRLYDHMHAVDGKSSPLIVVIENTTFTVNLQAFYNLETGLDKEDIDFDLDNMVVCSNSSYNSDLSKIAGEAMCSYSGLDFNSELYIGDFDGYGVHLRAMPADDNSDPQLSASSNLTDILLSCKEKLDDGTVEDCMPQ